MRLLVEYKTDFQSGLLYRVEWCREICTLVGGHCQFMHGLRRQYGLGICIFSRFSHMSHLRREHGQWSNYPAFQMSLIDWHDSRGRPMNRASRRMYLGWYHPDLARIAKRV